MTQFMDSASEAYVKAVAAAFEHVLHDDLVGVYLHGSAVLGGFNVHRSDIDILAVVREPIPKLKHGVVDAIQSIEVPCPAVGLEMSIVTLPSAANPTTKPLFEVHMTTAPQDSKVVDGDDHPGDPDLVLHYAVCRAAGRVLHGSPPDQVFAPVSEELIMSQLLDELHWASESAAGECAVLNACRAWLYAVERRLVSKIGGGQWAMDKAAEEEKNLVFSAIQRQKGRMDVRTDENAARRFVGAVIRRINLARSEGQ